MCSVKNKDKMCNVSSRDISKLLLLLLPNNNKNITEKYFKVLS